MRTAGLGLLLIISTVAALWLSWALPTEGIFALAAAALALAAAALLLRLWGKW
jgi:hypothetical protein